VPVAGGVGRIVHFGKLPVSTYAQVFRNVERPDGITSWSARFQMQYCPVAKTLAGTEIRLTARLLTTATA